MSDKTGEFVIERDTPQSLRIELTSAEKRRIDGYLQTIEQNNLRFDDKHLQTRINSEQGILSMGNKSLPYLREKLVDQNVDPSETYEFSRYASALAEEDDIDLLLQTMSFKGISQIEDMSSLSKLNKAVSRLVYDIRMANPQDTRLPQIARSLVSLIDAPETQERAKSYLITSLAVTGDPLSQTYTREYAEGAFDMKRNDNYFKDVATVPSYLRDREKFENWDDITRMRASVSDRDEVLDD